MFNVKTWFTLKACIGALMLSLAIAAPQANAQNTAPSAAGTWTCEMMMNQTFRNQPPVNRRMAFSLFLRPDGSAQAEGSDTAQWGTFPFEVTGQWGWDQGLLIVQGEIFGGSQQAWANSNGMPIYQELRDYVFASKPQNANYLFLEDQQGNDQVGYVRRMTQCQRQG